MIDELERWSEPALGARDRLRACFRLELPAQDGEPFLLRFLLQSPDDPSLLIAASEVWNKTQGGLQKLGRAFRDPEESLLEALGRAARLYPAGRARPRRRAPRIRSSSTRRTAWTFLGEGAAALSEAGFGVIVPAELTAAGRRRLRLRMRVGGASKKVAGVVAGAAGLGLDELLAVDWQAVVGDEAAHRARAGGARPAESPARAVPRRRGSPSIRATSKKSRSASRVAPPRSRARAAIQAVLAGETRHGELSVAVSASGAVAELVERLRSGSAQRARYPPSLKAELRPYQSRGLNWLVTMSSLGLGACLADDMGLGKTMQLLALLLHRLGAGAGDARPALLVAPTSVVGNWEREVERFAPVAARSSATTAPSGRARAKDVREAGRHAWWSRATACFAATRSCSRRWTGPSSRSTRRRTSRMPPPPRRAPRARSPPATASRSTGTPVENRLAELWSILEFGNPGLLGPLDTFRREFAPPIERHGNDDAASRLRRIVGPFILRRLKSDPTIIRDLPPKNEMKVVCTLTREQATLYKAVVDQELLRIEGSEGIERRGSGARAPDVHQADLQSPRALPRRAGSARKRAPESSRA